MSEPLTRQNITQALAIALRDQSETHERGGHAVIQRFMSILGRSSWVEMAISDYEDLCCVIEGSER